MRIRHFWLLWLSLLTLGFAQAQALIPASPLIAYFNGNLYRLNGRALVPDTACQPTERLTGQFYLSPNGLDLVMATVPPVMNSALVALGSVGDLTLGANLWLCNTLSGNLRRIYAVPHSDERFTGDLPPVEVLNSRPVWSPDGSQLAWSTYRPQSGETRIVVFIPATLSLIENPLDIASRFSQLAPPELYWSSHWIYFIVSNLNEQTFLIEDTLYTYRPSERRLLNTFVISTEGENSDFVIEQLPLSDSAGTPYLAQRYFASGWFLTQIPLGLQTRLVGQPELYSLSAPEGLALSMSISPNFDYNWSLNSERGTLNLEAYPPQRLAISPDGNALAYADASLHLWLAGNVLEVENSAGFADDFKAAVLWGTTAWRVPVPEILASPTALPLESPFATVTPPSLPSPTPFAECNPSVPSRLVAGSRARVISPLNNVRAEAQTGAALVGQLQRDSLLIVLSNRVCADGLAWYQVQAGVILGWTAEGSNGVYWLAPAGE